MERPLPAVERARPLAIPRQAVTIPEGAVQRSRLVRRIGRWALTTESFLAFLFLYLPIFVLVLYSFNASRFNASWAGFTLDWYRSLLIPDAVLVTEGASTFTARGVIESLQNSLIVASVSTVVSTILGTMIGVALGRYQFRGKRALDILIYLPIVIPEITMGIALLVFFSLLFGAMETLGTKPTLGIGTVIIGHIAFNIPFVAVIIRSRLSGFPASLEEAAADLGATPWHTFWKITIPLIMPAIIGGAMMAFTLSLDDFVITFFTAGVGSTTLPIFVYGMIKFAVTPAVNAISTLMLLGSMVLVIGSLWLQRRAS